MTPPRLQVALDQIDRDLAFAVAEQVIEFVDIVEAGTPLVKAAGIGVVQELKACFGKTVVADLKTMDAGYGEARLAFDNGADITTVLAVASLKTVEGVVEAAQHSGKEVMVDLMNTDPTEKFRELAHLSVSYYLFHRGIDQQSQIQSSWKPEALPGSPARVAVAGGLGPETVAQVVDFADIVIVGRAITAAPSPSRAARSIRGILRGEA